MATKSIPVDHRPFDESKISTEAHDAKSAAGVAVFYDRSYAGALQLIGSGGYRCAVSVLRKRQRILQAIGTVESLERGVRAVAFQYWKRNIKPGLATVGSSSTKNW